VPGADETASHGRQGYLRYSTRVVRAAFKCDTSVTNGAVGRDGSRVVDPLAPRTLAGRGREPDGTLRRAPSPFVPKAQAPPTLASECYRPRVVGETHGFGSTRTGGLF
jgi:hypothetical protein